MLLAATAAALLLAEGLVRWVDPPAVGKLRERLDDARALRPFLQPDPDLGHRPRPGPTHFAEHGAPATATRS